MSIENFCGAEKQGAAITLKLASAHLKELRHAHLVETRREGKNVIYRLTGEAVADFWVAISSLAEDRLLDLRAALAQLAEDVDALTPMGREELLAQAERGELLVLDVRPAAEFQAGHLPYAQSMPLEELHRRLAELPHDKPVAAYCRGPFCLMAAAAVELLRKEGFLAIRLEDGVAEWRAYGLPVATESRT